MASLKLMLDSERHGLMGEWNALAATLGAEQRDYTTDEQSRVNEIAARVHQIDGQLRIEEQRRELERTAPAANPTSTAPADPVRSVITGVHDRAADKPWGTDTGAPFGEFLQAVYRTKTALQVDPRLLYQAAAQGAGETVDSDGGFLVGKDMVNEIERRMLTGDILSRVTFREISGPSNGVTIRVVDETSRATGSRFGGVQGYWVDEGSAPTKSKPTFHKIELKLKKVAALGYASDELLQDAALLQSTMTGDFEEELRFLTEDAFINGSGTDQPQGVLNAAALVSVSKETGQAATTIVKANIDKMWARMWAPARRNAVWLINQDIEPQLESLAMDVGTGGVPVYLPSGGIADAPNARLKGRPVIPVEYCATLGTVGDIILADLSQYLAIRKGGVAQASSLHVAFTTDEMAFRATYRVDGQAKWKAALTPFKGTGNTLSPFVALATRA